MLNYVFSLNHLSNVVLLGCIMLHLGLAPRSQRSKSTAGFPNAPRVSKPAGSFRGRPLRSLREDAEHGMAQSFVETRAAQFRQFPKMSVDVAGP